MSPSTDVTIDGQKSSADQLQQGAQVRAAYQGSGDDQTATRIEATSAKQGSSSSSSGMQGSSGASGTPGSSPSQGSGSR